MNNFSFKRVKKVIKTDLLLNGKRTFLYSPLIFMGLFLFLMIIDHRGMIDLFGFLFYMFLFGGFAFIAQNINKQIFQSQGTCLLSLPATAQEKSLAYLVELLVLFVWITVLYFITVVFWNIISAEEIGALLNSEYEKNRVMTSFYITNNSWLIPKVFNIWQIHIFRYFLPLAIIFSGLFIYNSINFSKLYGLITVVELFSCSLIGMKILTLNMTSVEISNNESFENVMVVSTYATNTLTNIWEYAFPSLLWIGALLMLYVVYTTFKYKELR